MNEMMRNRESGQLKVSRLSRLIARLNAKRLKRDAEELFPFNDGSVVPLLEHGNGGTIYGPSGRLGVIGRIGINKIAERDLGDGLPPRPLN